jgi:heme/copper-type cytochrome/quinol oxidase subunit 2
MMKLKTKIILVLVGIGLLVFGFFVYKYFHYKHIADNAESASRIQDSIEARENIRTVYIPGVIESLTTDQICTLGMGLWEEK